MKISMKHTRNKGAPGIDGMTVSELKGYLEENLDVIKEQIRTRKYKPSPVKRVETMVGQEI